MRIPVLAIVEQDGQAPNDPEIPVPFHEHRWIRHLPPLVSLERQLSIPPAERLRSLEPAQAHVIKRVMPKLNITSRQLSDAMPHSRAERCCARVGFTKKGKEVFRASPSKSSKVPADSLVCDERFLIQRSEQGAGT